MLKHLACVMDGNRRWAQQRGLPTLKGHYEGANTAKRVIQFCIDQKISYLSLYTFSLENFRRSVEEKTYLFDLLVRGVTHGMQEFVDKGVRVRFIGDRTLFPPHVLDACQIIEKMTEHNNLLHVSFLFCYGARQEIAQGVKRIIQQVQAGLLSFNDVSDSTLDDYLWTFGIPDPDIIVRTGGAQRLSNFLLYQAAYSEFYFFECMWPELTDAHLNEVLTYFNTCQRNYGS